MVNLIDQFELQRQKPLSEKESRKGEAAYFKQVGKWQERIRNLSNSGPKIIPSLSQPGSFSIKI